MYPILLIVSAVLTSIIVGVIFIIFLPWIEYFFKWIGRHIGRWQDSMVKKVNERYKKQGK